MTDEYNSDRAQAMQAWGEWYERTRVQHDEMKSWLEEVLPDIAKTWSWADTVDHIYGRD